MGRQRHLELARLGRPVPLPVGDGRTHPGQFTCVELVGAPRADVDQVVAERRVVGRGGRVGRCGRARGVSLRSDVAVNVRGLECRISMR
jgi:hypothetical protein